MNAEHETPPAADEGRRLSEQLGLGAMLPACWTLTETLDAKETTTAGYLWFKNPQNAAWEPLYRRAALTRVLGNAKEVQQHNAELLADAERWRKLRDTPATAVPPGPMRQWLYARPGGAESMDRMADELPRPNVL